jgi:threonyl-tRNA synthetase
MVTISLPDGARREFSDGATGATVAEAISKSLAKKAVAIRVDGVLVDLAESVPDGASIQIVTRDDPAALELIRHDCAHVLAEAVQELFPGTQVTIGPVIENGFYYDFFSGRAVFDGRFCGDRIEDARDHRAQLPFHQRSLEPRSRARCLSD